MARARTEPEATPAAGRSRRAGRGSPAASWASTEGAEAGGIPSGAVDGPNPLGLEPGPAFVPEQERPPVTRAADLEAGEEYVPAAPEPVEWTPERAAALLRGVGFVAHMADPVSREPGAEQLWKFTQADAVEAGAPLSRILNRYEPARRLAGVSDETELAFVLGSHVMSNLGLRGRVLKAAELVNEPAGPFDGAESQPAPIPETPFGPVKAPTTEG